MRDFLQPGTVNTSKTFRYFESLMAFQLYYGLLYVFDSNVTDESSLSTFEITIYYQIFNLTLISRHLLIHTFLLSTSYMFNYCIEI